MNFRICSFPFAARQSPEDRRYKTLRDLDVAKESRSETPSLCKRCSSCLDRFTSIRAGVSGVWKVAVPVQWNALDVRATHSYCHSLIDLLVIASVSDGNDTSVFFANSGSKRLQASAWRWRSLHLQTAAPTLSWVLRQWKMRCFAFLFLCLSVSFSKFGSFFAYIRSPVPCGLVISA